MAYLAPTIWGMFIPAFGRVGAIRMTFTLMAAIAFICMLVPVFCIREKDYVDTVPAKESAFGAAVFCCIGGIILVFYNEKKINGIINRHQ